MLIRPATLQDQPGILEIYNESVLHSTATFDTDPRSPEKQLEWFKRHKANHPVLVAEDDGKIAGWASLSPWSDRCAYDSTVEVSVYLAPEQRGKGLGFQLLQQVTEAGRKAGNHTVISRISSDNLASIRIHEKAGYSTVGTMKEVGFKFGRFLDVVMMQIVF
ncbi:MAG: N-acetyltransferase [Bacteroidia bacterium]|nr:N-acetyltransferase [Bacteroidia bacterium]MBP7436585.1 N-acetyltransferase [Bacteroidia bacterium]MBP7727721.1 N-acetyltransferase [Bacteroidia bacterium]MBP7772353.1 N-acetyltransferase [Bacteroidia bacterium]HPD53262.1 N-acetyltransferase family protein [Bacteroidia bacterium]